MIQGSYSCGAVTNIDSTITCELSNGNLMNITNIFLSRNLSANDIVSFNIEGIWNPISTNAQSGIIITFYGPDGGMVDTGSITLQVTQPASILSGTVTSGNKIVQESTAMRLSFPIPVPLNAGCVIDI